MSTSETTDYSTWSRQDLLQRVSDLESRLRAQNNSHTRRSLAQSPPKKPRKAPKPFDSSRYNTRLIALKFAYLGGDYNGFEHHNNNTTPLPTIEEVLWKALKKTRLIFPSIAEDQSEDEVCWDGVEYSKCGRTDRGVSAFGQVVGLRVRSQRPKTTSAAGCATVNGSVADDSDLEAVRDTADEELVGPVEVSFDPIRDELPYVQLLNRVLPPDIRILAWCPDPPSSFSARFNCKERRYRYFFTNPAYAVSPGVAGSGALDIRAMQQAAQKYEGLHDFRNFCKVDPSKQISNFQRRIFHAGIHEVNGEEQGHVSSKESGKPRLYYFEVRGSAFLWHQVRHLVAILFMVGQGYEAPSVVDDLLDIQKTPSRPKYDMASDKPLVLWDCIFPAIEQVASTDHYNRSGVSNGGYEDGLEWVYIGDEAGGRDPSKRSTPGVDDGKHGRNGIMDDLWALWRRRRMDEVLAQGLMDVVAAQGQQRSKAVSPQPRIEKSDSVFDGSERVRMVGTYIPVLQRERTEAADVVNTRYAVRKGLNGSSRTIQGADASRDVQTA